MLAAVHADFPALDAERLVEGHGLKVFDMNLAGQGDHVAQLVHFAHGFVEEGGDDAAVAVAGRSGVALAQAKAANESLARFIEGELQAHPVRIIQAAGEAEVLLQLDVTGVVAVGVRLSGHGSDFNLRAVLAFAEDTVNPNLLFAGTEFGAFFTIDGGQHWVRLKGGLPTIAVRDMVIQAREGDLVIATFGRGFYVLDDITPLRQIKPESVEQAAAMFPVKDALLYMERHPLGGPKKGFQGDAFYAADNPPYGAVFTAYLKDKVKTKKEKRQDAEKEAAKKDQTLPYPTNDELRAETEEAKPELYFMVYDESGTAIRRVDGSVDSGFQRAAWDLRYPPSRVHAHSNEGEEDDFPDATEQGPLVLSGNYSVRTFEKVDGAVTEIAGPQSFKVVTEGASAMNPADRAAQEEFLRKTARLYRAVNGALHTAEDVESRLKTIREALREVPAVEKQLGAVADSIERRDREILRALRGDVEIARRNENVPSSIDQRVISIMEGERFSLQKPTQSHVDSYNIAAAEFVDQLAKLHALVEVDLANLEKDMEAAGAPWTPGRVPEWSEK